MSLEHLSERFGKAFDDYLALGDELRADMESMLNIDPTSHAVRRNWIRISSALIEGNLFAISRLCVVLRECENVAELTQPEIKALENAKNCSFKERFKLVFRAAHKTFALTTSPDFGGQEWQNASAFFDLRNNIIHPKNVQSIQVTKQEWDNEYFPAMLWLSQQVLSFLEALQIEYAK